MLIDPRQHQILSLLRRCGPLSRQELHVRMGIRPNTIGDLVEDLVRRRMLREGAPQVNGPGRPRVPLEIDPQGRRVVGLALEPGRVSLTQLNLHGLRVSTPLARAASASTIVRVAADLLGSLDLASVSALGITATGFIDTDAHALLLSSTTARSSPVSLEPLYRAAGEAHVILENDLQALALQWMMTHEAEADDDILLIHVRDGAVGAAVLIQGRPIRGCVMGGNELGHMRLPVDTPKCYCGHIGCLERIVSSEYLAQHDGRRRSPRALTDAAESYRQTDAPMREIIRYLAMGIGNSINLLRPRRVVLASAFNRYTAFTNELLDEIRQAMLAALQGRVRIDLWDRQDADFAVAAGWMALASIYHPEAVVPAQPAAATTGAL